MEGGNNLPEAFYKNLTEGSLMTQAPVRLYRLLLLPEN